LARTLAKSPTAIGARQWLAFTDFPATQANSKNSGASRPAAWLPDVSPALRFCRQNEAVGSAPTIHHQSTREF
jgi:hypothetical protein